MRWAAALAAALIAAPGLARAEDWAAAFTLSADHAGGALQIQVVAKPGYYVNSAFPLKLDLSPTGATLAKAALTRADARFTSAGKEGKATRADFTVGTQGAGRVDGRYKLSICTDEGCSPPLKGAFATEWAAAPPPPAVRAAPPARRVGAALVRRPADAARGCRHPARPGALRVGP